MTAEVTEEFWEEWEVQMKRYQKQFIEEIPRCNKHDVRLMYDDTFESKYCPLCER